MQTIYKSLLLVALSLYASISAAEEESQTELYSQPEEQSAFLEAKIREYFPDENTARVMIAIARCESSGSRSGPIQHWTTNGDLLPNDQGGQARGMFQVMSKLHAQDMQRRNLDIQNLDDYMTFVRYLYDRNNGFHDWYPSKSCWQSVQLAQN